MDDTRTPSGRGDDELVARLRAADPAADATPDLDRVHARLAEQTGVPLAAGTPAADGTTPVDELAAARARRRGRTRWLQVAAAAAAFAVVGGGGYAVGASGAPGTASDTAYDTVGAAAPITLPGAGGAAEGAPEALSGAATEDARMIAPGFGGRTVFSGDGLGTEGASAHAWAFDAAAVVGAETAARVAETLGVDGEPRLEWGQWVVGPNDGTGATVTLSVDGQASVGFYDRAWDPTVCTASADDSLTEDGAAEPGSDAAPMPVDPVEPDPADPSVCDPATTPTGDAAVERVRTLLADLGVDPAGYAFEVFEDTGVEGLVSVQAAQVVDGTQTGVAWSVSLAGTGVQSVWGALAPLVDLGEYAVISPAAAVERLNDPRFGASYGGVVPLAARGLATADQALQEMADEPAVDPEAEPTVPTTPEPGSAVAWPVQQVELVDARLGVSLVTLPDGAAVLVPAWELTDAEGTPWSVVAVADDQLDLSPVG
ncbi:hypothetical protein [Cellulomonas sp. SLBN-39]|uniref:hypothetical protein n=1 Tax=Cellulomonas sp. SLBN-39 TaxID=2768446 RepID=UPI0011511A6D|nr:hypothetical protein [Cellulomonas sp. SLBN-39]TQL01750.1 hypothetical protein FBY24_0808 [Cellulomonas sp. SLBN-39]